ncbi:hypothetical protein MACJ_002253 [Theileria orientalis]|uniref:Uncharacterized protein n=1 Tax=Theileria orientalis TaxID=68886 RepID=A0A976QQF8_THEOR|nr:hypothetical protein MACJ_002253 [Theileria orientalis]
MSKKKSKKPKIGNTAPNPFERFDSKKINKELNLSKNTKNKSKFIKKFKDSQLVYDRSSKKSRKLQLYNLNDNFTLTHKNEPIDNNYESDLDPSSDEEFDVKGDYSNISETYKQYKELREQSRRDKEHQRSLLSKLDKDFEGLDFSQFYKPTKNTREYLKTQEKPQKLDEYESNLKQLQLNRTTSEFSIDLVREYRSCSKVEDRVVVVNRIIKSDTILPNFAQDYLKGYLESLSEYLEKEDTSNFGSYLDTFSRGFLHLSNKNQKEYKVCLEDQLESIESLDKELTKYLLIFLVVKTVELNTHIYKHTLLLLENYSKALYGELLKGKSGHKNQQLAQIKLLLVISYNCIIESGYYIPYFYHLSIKTCTLSETPIDLVLAILKTVKITLNILFKNDCNISSILKYIIVPSLTDIQDQFEHKKNTLTVEEDKIKEFIEFKEYIEGLTNIKYPTKSLDIYNTEKLKVEYPRIKTYKSEDKREKKSKGEKYSKKGEKRDREEYKTLKRALIRETLIKADQSSQKRAKQRLETERRYKEVVRNAYMEQEMLKKLSTTKEMMFLSKLRLFSTNLYKFNKLATSKLQDIYDKLEFVDEVDTLEFDGSVLNVEFNNNKYILINKHEPSQQLWYSSFTGVDYFQFENDKWVSTNTGMQE